MDDLATAILEGTSIARLKALLDSELERGARELGQKRSGYEQPVIVAVAPGDGALRAVAPAPMEEHGAAVLAALDRVGGSDFARPHDDPDPVRRVARRILQRLDGMGKWGGYHTDFAHLARGFAGNERALAEAVGEALLAAGLLAEKPSVGQRHVFLNPRRAGDIPAPIERGEGPADLELP